MRVRAREVPFPLHEVGLRSASPRDLDAISEEFGLALNREEMRRIQEHFRAAGRDPTDVELQALGQAWSEHSRY